MKNVEEIIREIVDISRTKQKNFVYILKINLPNEIKPAGKKKHFQELLIKLIKNSEQAYQSDNLQNRIILITSKIENSKNFSMSVTNGGIGLSFLEKALIKQKAFIFREKATASDIFQINKILEKEFKGKLEIISKKNRGSTLKCFFPLE